MANALTFKIGADTAGFQKGISGAMKGLVGLGAAFISTRAVVDSFSSAIDMGGRLAELSQRTGETAGNMAILERTFKNTGAGAEKAAPSIARMQKTIQEASEGSKGAVDSLGALGLSAADLVGKLPIEQMQIVADRISQIEDPTQRSAAAMGIFGKSGAELLPMLRNFSSEIAGAKDQLGSLPDILDESSGKFDSVGDSLEAIKTKTTELSVGFLSELLPAVEKVIDAMTGLDAAGFGQKLGFFFSDSTKAKIDKAESDIRNATRLRDLADRFAGDGQGTRLGSMYQDEIDAATARKKKLEEQLFIENTSKEYDAITAKIEADKKKAEAEAMKSSGSQGPADALDEWQKDVNKIFDKELFSDISEEMRKAFTDPQAELNKQIADAIETNQTKEIISAMDELFGDRSSRTPQSSAQAAPTQSATVGRQPRATSIKGAKFKDSFGSGLRPGSENDPINRGASLYGFNPDGTPRTKEEFETGKKMSPQEKAQQAQQGKMDGGKKESTQDPIMSVLNAIKATLDLIEPKLPQHVLT